MNSLRAMLVNCQKSEASNDDYLKEFQARVATINILDLISHPLEEEIKEKYNKDVKDANETELMAAKENMRKKTSAALLLIGADHERYRDMKNRFQQNMALGTNKY